MFPNIYEGSYSGVSSTFFKWAKLVLSQFFRPFEDLLQSKIKGTVKKKEIQSSFIVIGFLSLVISTGEWFCGVPD